MRSCLIMMMMPDVLLVSVYYKCVIMSAEIQVYMPIYLLDAIYHHAVIGLMHITDGVLVIYIF